LSVFHLLFPARVSDSRLHHRRFFVPTDSIHQGGIEFGPAQAHQMAHVLRLRPGDRIVVFDGTGRELIASLVTTTPRRARARILSEAPPLPLPRLRITLAQVVPRGPAMDRIVAKATELGVVRIVPLEGERSVRRVSGRNPRWGRILQEAAEQCGRRDLPDLAPTITLEDFLRCHPEAVPLLAGHAGEGARPLAALCLELGPLSEMTFLVGGEGGLSPKEVEALSSHGARLAWLGPRLLRAETAALAGLTILQACVGDWRDPANEKQTTDN
jgi:16S rRNA (uracil1498-N3)-methyltransferase